MEARIEHEMAEEDEIEEEELEEPEEPKTPVTEEDALARRLDSAHHPVATKEERVQLEPLAGTDIAKDALKRGGIVKSLIGLIRRLPKNSTVIAVEGKWGDGKTTVLNYVRKQLSPQECVFIDLEPWHWSKTGDMTALLARNLEDKLFEESKSEAQRGRDNVSEALDRIADHLSGTSVQSAGKNALRLTLVILAPVIAIAGIVLKQLWSSQTTSNVALVLAALVAFGLTVKFAPQMLAFIARLLKSRRLHVQAYVDKLDKEGKKLICVLDDVDRLTRDQILELCQILKVSLNVPGIHYVLCIDRVAVQDIIGGHTENLVADHYLEKIIQHRVYVSTPSPELVATELEAELSAVLENEKELPRIDQGRYELVFSGIVMKDCRNLRDVQQVRDMFRLMLDATRDSEGRIHIDIPDLLALASTLVFDPRGYDLILQRFHHERTAEDSVLDLFFGFDKEKGHEKDKDSDGDFRADFCDHKTRRTKRMALAQYLFPDKSGRRLFRPGTNETIRRFQDDRSTHLYFAMSGESFLSSAQVAELMDKDATAYAIADRLRSLSEDQRGEFASMLQIMVDKKETVPSSTLIGVTAFADEYERPDTLLEKHTKKHFWRLPSRFFGSVVRYYSDQELGERRLGQLQEFLRSHLSLPLKIEVLVSANRHAPMLHPTLLSHWATVHKATEEWLLNPTSATSPFYLNVMFRHRDYVGEDAHVEFYSGASDELIDGLMRSTMNHFSHRKTHPWKDSADDYTEHLRELFGERVHTWLDAHRSEIAASRLGVYFRARLSGEVGPGDGMISRYELQNWYHARGLQYPGDESDDD